MSTQGALGLSGAAAHMIVQGSSQRLECTIARVLGMVVEEHGATAPHEFACHSGAIDGPRPPLTVTMTPAPHPHLRASVRPALTPPCHRPHIRPQPNNHPTHYPPRLSGALPAMAQPMRPQPITDTENSVFSCTRAIARPVLPAPPPRAAPAHTPASAGGKHRPARWLACRA